MKASCPSMKTKHIQKVIDVFANTKYDCVSAAYIRKITGINYNTVCTVLDYLEAKNMVKTVETSAGVLWWWRGSSMKGKLTCPICKKEKSWEQFSYGVLWETTPIVCRQCLKEGKVKRTFLPKEIRVVIHP